MILAKRIAPRTPYARLALGLIGGALLGGCQSLQPSAPAEVQADGWRVVERLGDARYLAPDASGWAPALPAATLPAGSQVATGAGGRVILARDGDHISAGPTSRFSLPPAAPGGSLEQQAGGLRYRVAPTATEALVVETPFLEIAVRGTVFDVTVSPTATEVTVEAGQVRIATPDGLRHIELEAGQSAYAGGPTGAQLAFRRAQGEPVEAGRGDRPARDAPEARADRRPSPAGTADARGRRRAPGLELEHGSQRGGGADRDRRGHAPSSSLTPPRPGATDPPAASSTAWQSPRRRRSSCRSRSSPRRIARAPPRRRQARRARPKPRRELGAPTPASPDAAVCSTA